MNIACEGNKSKKHRVVFKLKLIGSFYSHLLQFSTYCGFPSSWPFPHGFILEGGSGLASLGDSLCTRFSPKSDSNPCGTWKATYNITNCHARHNIINFTARGEEPMCNRYVGGTHTQLICSFLPSQWDLLPNSGSFFNQGILQLEKEMPGGFFLHAVSMDICCGFCSHPSALTELWCPLAKYLLTKSSMSRCWWCQLPFHLSVDFCSCLDFGSSADKFSLP